MDAFPDLPVNPYLCEADIEKATITCVRRHELGGHSFLPADRIKALLTPQNVKQTLEAFEVTSTTDLLDFVHHRGSKVFLTLVAIGELKSLVDFEREDLRDEHLPLERKLEGGTRKRRVVESLNETTKPSCCRRWPFLARWKPNVLNSFLVQQWRFLAPTFGKTTFYQCFHKNRPLPFVEVAEGLHSDGHFSSVDQVRIHEAHADPEVFENVHIAVKVFKPGLGDYFDRERERLEIIRQFNHPHLIRPLAAYDNGIQQGFLFPWANGGSLRDYWKRNNQAVRDEALVSWTLSQISGLCDCLRLLWKRNCRHGDLKPENILLDDGRGNFFIADVGLSKFHVDGTARRDRSSSMKYRTHRYEAPEISTYKFRQPISRDSDMWPMGVVLLEWMVWLIYGNERLIQLNALDVFWERSDNKSRVRQDVRELMDKMTEALPDDTALHDIVDLVRSRLLLVELVGNINEKPGPGRAKAEELSDRVNKITERAQLDPSYRVIPHNIWSRTENSKKADATRKPSEREVSVSRPAGSSTTILDPNRENLDMADNNNIPSITVDPAEDTLGHQALSLPRDEYSEHQNKQLNDAWHSEPDDGFARSILSQVDWATLKPSPESSTLCSSCMAMDIWSQGFQILYSMSELEEKSTTCHVCGLFYRSLLGHGLKTGHKGSLVRVGSNLKTESIAVPIISVYLDPGNNRPELAASPSHSGQLGFPQLPGPGSPEQLLLLREWLQNCDKTHECGCHRPPDIAFEMPTRLIDVGSREEPKLHLIETLGAVKANYIALSHCWGMIDEPFRFCTYRNNIEKHIKEGIDFGRLPKTFRDAVEVTRDLGVQYLWIDSLCIIQEDKDDWEAEVGKMESVFSMAYCTIAASSAASHLEGLMYPRKPRPCVAIENRDSKIYLCQAIDNFHDDVERAVLNTRGWVLQERALSRRTIHFTSNQVYWECGKGVHCETLARLRNSKAEFLGDSDFPNSLLNYYRDGRIGLFQELYGTYSRLDFKELSDRSMGVLGLERRLVRTLETEGDYGILKRYLQRSLLWKRHGSARLRPIPYPDDRSVPSWSWMAYRGEISFVDPPFNSVEWFEGDIKDPFKGGPLRYPSQRWEGKPKPEIEALAREIDMSKDPIEIRKRIVFDEVTVDRANSLRCVVLGRDKAGDEGQRNHYVLVIRPSTPELPAGPYLRVGSGSLLASHISSPDGEWVHIQ
ncbi:HET-domain-containing protein [Xylariaceae sp. FL0662B]|nr:HET-domain-containing protein [Xylariaceae sp. FL0662B]